MLSGWFKVILMTECWAHNFWTVFKVFGTQHSTGRSARRTLTDRSASVQIPIRFSEVFLLVTTLTMGKYILKQPLIDATLL